MQCEVAMLDGNLVRDKPWNKKWHINIISCSAQPRTDVSLTITTSMTTTSGQLG